MTLSPLTRRRLSNFRANRRGWWSLWIFAALFLVTLFAELIANDRPIVAKVEGHWFFPVVVEYAESDLLSDGFPTAADWHDPVLVEEVERGLHVGDGRPHVVGPRDRPRWIDPKPQAGHVHREGLSDQKMWWLAAGGGHRPISSS